MFPISLGNEINELHATLNKTVNNGKCECS